MEELKRKYKEERRNNRNRSADIASKKEGNELIQRLSEKYGQTPEQKAPPKKPKFQSRVRHNKKMVLHNINEEDSELEEGSD